MNKKVARYIVVLLLVTFVVVPIGCIFRGKFANDPVKWSFVNGDGSWDSNSRRWTVYLSPGETKSIIIRLYNSSARPLVVYTVPVGPTDTILLSPQERLHIFAGGSMDITLTATAYEIATSGSHRYIMNYGNSFNDMEP